MGSADRAWVLVIEDARDQAELCAEVCAGAGFNAITAATGVQGYRKARDLQPDVIVLDLALPDVDGWDVSRRLKMDERTKHIPIVMLTARHEPRNLQRAAEAGCTAYLTKPCPPAELVVVLKSALAERERV